MQQLLGEPIYYNGGILAKTDHELYYNLLCSMLHRSKDNTTRKRIYEQMEIVKPQIQRTKEYDINESLEICNKIYRYLKEHHNDLKNPKHYRISEPLKKCEPFGSYYAHCHREGKGICISKKSLKYRSELIGDCTSNEIRYWRVLEGNFFFIDLMAHEVAHQKIDGSHGKRFRERNLKLMQTLVNWVISGDFYR